MKQLKFYFSILILSTFTLFQINCSSSGTNNKKTTSQNLVEPREIDINFDSMEEGDYPKSYGGLSVFKFGGNKVIGTPAEGNYSFDIKNHFPLDFRFNLALAGNSGNSNKYYCSVTLMSPNGDLSFWILPQPVRGGKWDFGFYNTKITGSIVHSNNVLSNVEVQKNGDIYKLYLDNKFVCSLQNNEFYQFTGVRIIINSYEKFSTKGDGFCISKISISRL